MPGRRVAGRSSGARTTVILACVAVAVVLAGCSQQDSDQVGRLALPVPVTDRAEYVKDLWGGAWLAAAVVGVFVWALIIWVVVRYRRRSEDEVPTQTRYNLPIEVLYTIAPLIVIAVLFYFTIDTQRAVAQGAYRSNPGLAVETVDAEAVAAGGGHLIQVVGQKWAWTFSYLDEPALGGDTDVYDVGTPEEFTDLYLPVGEPVTFTLDSPDVIHSFWIPEFIFKLDVIPGFQNSFTVTPTVEGTFRGLCAELCGDYHSRMRFYVHIVSPEEYEQHLRDLEAAGQVGAPKGNYYSYTIAGAEDEGDTE